MSQYLFYFERENGEFVAVESDNVKTVQKLYAEYEKKSPKDIVSFGWRQNDDSLSTKLIKKKAKMIEVNNDR